jgi:hypothetical protein
MGHRLEYDFCVFLVRDSSLLRSTTISLHRDQFPRIRQLRESTDQFHRRQAEVGGAHLLFRPVALSALKRHYSVGIYFEETSICGTPGVGGIGQPNFLTNDCPERPHAHPGHMNLNG